MDTHVVNAVLTGLKSKSSLIESYLRCMTHAYNCTKHASTTYSPYYLMFDRHPRLPIDVEFGLPKPNCGDNSSKSRYIQKLRSRLNYAYQKLVNILTSKLRNTNLAMIKA